MKFSVIIPAYNIEKYIQRSVMSVLAQSFSDYEIVIVDDGSTDNTYRICEKISKSNYSKVKFVSQANQGLSVARNTGINVSTGEYLLFLDGDDYWAGPSVLSELDLALRDKYLDFLCFSYSKEYSGNRKDNYLKAYPLGFYIEYFDFRPIKNSKFNDYQFYISSAVVKVVKRDFLIRINGYFEPGRLSEDISWSAHLLAHARNYAFLNKNFYIYSQRDGSISKTISPKNCIDVGKAISESVTLLNKDQTINNEILKNYIAFQIATLIKVQSMTTSFQSNLISEISKYSYLLNTKTYNKKLRLIQKLNNIIGYEKLCYIIWKINKIVKNK